MRFKVVFLYILATSLLVLSGCVDADLTVKVNRDGTGEMKGLILLEDSGVDFRDMIIPQAEIDSLREKGIKVEAVKKGEKVGYSLSKPFNMKEFKSDRPKNSNSKIGMVNDLVDVTTKKDLFFTTYKIQGDLNFLNFMSKEQQSLVKLIGSEVNMKLNFILPIKASGSNADQEVHLKEGYKYSWNLEIIENKDLQLIIKVPNYVNILYLIAGILSIVAVYFTIKKVKKQKE